MPVDQALTFLPQIDLTRLASHYLRQGQAISVSHRHPPGTWVRLYEEGLRLYERCAKRLDAAELRITQLAEALQKQARG